MKRRFLTIWASASALALTACQTAPTRPETASAHPAGPVAIAWGFDRSDVQPDPDWRYGVLPNGMRYAIRRNTTPLGSASIRLRIDMGSTAEADDQQGLAHFLEHMAFNGSTHVPEGEMVKILERFGLAFGADTNASTSFTETVYKLDLPRTSDDVIDTGLMLMRETASELTLDPGAIDRERGIILSERRARDQYGLRRLIHYLNFALPGTPVARRLPIGTVEVIRGASAARMRDLYTRFYTPDRAVLIVAGDIEPDAIEAKIRARFADWKGGGIAEGDPATGTIDPARPTEAAYFTDPDVPASASILAAKPADTSPDSEAKRRKSILEALGNSIVSRRLAKIARQDAAPIVSGAASGSSLFRTAELATVDITAKDGDWKSALAIGDRELRRALEHGFTRAELAEQLANVRQAFENGARQADTRRSDALANALAAAVEDRLVATPPAHRLAQFNAFAPEISLAAVEAAFRAQWAGANPLIHISGKQPIADAGKTILAAYEASRKVAVTAVADDALTDFAYKDFGPAGKIAEDGRIADLDIRTIRFANNVRLSIKRTDFERDRVRVSLRVASGALEFGKDKPGLRMFMNSAFAAGGLAAHSLDELQSLTAGRSVSLGLAASDEFFGTTTATTPEDLEFQMQLLAAYVTAPGFRTEADMQWQNRLPVIYDTFDSSPAAIAARDLPGLITDGDPRFGVPPLAVLQQRNMAELRPAIAHALAKGAIEIGVAGDVDEQAAIDIVARTFGALPEREPAPAPFAEARRVSFRESRAPVTLYHEGKADEAMAMRYWPTTDDGDFAIDARLSVLAAVMELMLTEELRETLGATYSPNAYSSSSSVYPGFGQIVASSNLDVEDIPKVEAAVDAIAAKLRSAPVSADMLLRARRPILERIDKSRRENGAWIALIDEAQTEPRWLERFREARPVYEAITAGELMQAARQYLDPAKALSVRIVARPSKSPN